MSSLPPSSTPTDGDDSTLTPLPAAAPATESAIAAEAPAEQPADAPAAEPVAAESAVEQPVAEAAAEQPAAAPASAQEDCGPQLKKLYPALFSNPPKPLKLRIQADIQARSPGAFTKAQLSAFLRRYTGSHAYLNALVKATHRFDLDGNQGDELSDEHRAAATEELARRKANTQARVALEAEQRANRAKLLKEFEANTLPAAEFSASKGIPEAELEPLIARARKEASEPPPAPAFNKRDRRGAPPPRGPRADGPRQDGPRRPRPPRPTEGAAPAAPAAEGQAEAPRAPRPPRDDRPRQDRPRADGPRGDGPRPPRPQGPRTEGPRGPRPEGPRADGPRGDNRPPRQDGPRPRRDDDRRPPRDDARGPRPNVASKPEGPTAMALAFGALRGLDLGKTKK